MSNPEPTAKTYHCALCGESFKFSGDSAQDAYKAVQEYQEVFGEPPTSQNSEIVCDDCYKKIMAFHGH